MDLKIQFSQHNWTNIQHFLRVTNSWRNRTHNCSSKFRNQELLTISNKIISPIQTIIAGVDMIPISWQQQCTLLSS